MKEFKTVGKCAYCNDPILDFQAKVKVGKEQLHKGCLHILVEENPLPDKDNQYHNVQLSN